MSYKLDKSLTFKGKLLTRQSSYAGTSDNNSTVRRVVEASSGVKLPAMKKFEFASPVKQQLQTRNILRKLSKTNTYM